MKSRKFGEIEPLEVLGRIFVGRAKASLDAGLDKETPAMLEIEATALLEDMAPPEKDCFDAARYYVVGACDHDSDKTTGQHSRVVVYHATPDLARAVTLFARLLGLDVPCVPEPSPKPVHGPVKSLSLTLINYLTNCGIL